MKKVSAFLLVLFFMAAPSFAQQVEEAASVPSGISNSDYQFLVEQKKHLDETRGLLVKDIDAFNSDCGKVSSSDSGKIEECTKRQELILARVDTYNRDLVRYQESIQRAQAKAPKIIGFEKGDKNSAPVPTNLEFKAPEPEAKPLELSAEEKAELKDTMAEGQKVLVAQRDKFFKKAKAQAAWDLGFYLVDQGKNEEAVQYFQEARMGFDDNSAEAAMVENAIRDAKELKPTSAQYPVYKNGVELLMTALQYGNRDWEASRRYLEAAQKANPNDPTVKDAMKYFEPVYQEEKGKQRDFSLGQIKPRK